MLEFLPQVNFVQLTGSYYLRRIHILKASSHEQKQREEIFIPLWDHRTILLFFSFQQLVSDAEEQEENMTMQAHEFSFKLSESSEEEEPQVSNNQAEYSQQIHIQNSNFVCEKSHAQITVWFLVVQILNTSGILKLSSVQMKGNEVENEPLGKTSFW